MIRQILLLGGFVLLQSVAPVTGEIGFREETLRQHRIAGETTVVVRADDRAWYGETRVRVTIGVDGAVTDARVSDSDNYGRQDHAAALAAARMLRFRPFTYRGKPVVAAGTVLIDYAPSGVGGWRHPDAALPPIDYASLKITLTRTACYGDCPGYRVTIDGAGKVTFSTREEPVPGAAVYFQSGDRSNVLVPGTHQATIDRATLDALIAQFRAIHFFGLWEGYTGASYHAPTQVIRFESGGRAFEVTDYVGHEAGMPAAVTALEQAIDAAAGTARWVTGDARTLPLLLAEGLDVRGEDARNLALRSSEMADGRVAIDLIAAGMPLDPQVRYRQRDHDRQMPLGAALLENAARRSQPELFAVMAAKGWLARIPRAELGTLFAESSGGCDPVIARAMVAAGADPNARIGPNPKGYGIGVENMTVLTMAIESYECDDALRPGLVTALVALGVDINAVDARGESAIFGVEDPDILEFLLSKGARVDIRGKDGNSAVFASWTDVIVLRLLEAGASPRGLYDVPGEKKKTLRQMAHERDMPAVLVWLDAHGIP